MVHISSVSQGYFTMEQVCMQPSRLKELKYFILRVVVAKMLKPLFHFHSTSQQVKQVVGGFKNYVEIEDHTFQMRHSGVSSRINKSAFM